MKNATERRDHFQELTTRIVTELEKGRIPWHREWDKEKCGGPLSPHNGVTGRRYHGINVLILGMLDMRPALTGDPRWATYNQAQEAGYQVKKGEKATTIFFAKQLEVDNKDRNESDPEKKLIHMMKPWSVFHFSQLEGAPEYIPPTVEQAPWTRPEAAQIILDNSKAVIHIGGDRAFYSPLTDHIQMPPDVAFHGPDPWSVTMLHEQIHRTGHSTRLNRDLTGSFQSKSYAFEELIAELGSVFVGTTLGLTTNIPNHASYIAGWKQLLKEDSRAIFRAAAQAQKAADYVLNFHPDFASANAAEQRAADLPHQFGPRTTRSHLRIASPG